MQSAMMVACVALSPPLARSALVKALSLRLGHLLAGGLEFLPPADPIFGDLWPIFGNQSWAIFGESTH